MQASAKTGAPASVRIRAITESDAALESPWPADRIAWLFVRTGGTQDNFETLPAVQPGASRASVTIPAGGVAVVGLDFQPTAVEVDAATLRSFAEQHIAKDGAPDLSKLTGNVRVRRIESSNALVRSDAPGVNSAALQSKTGQKVEIRPLADPTRCKVGSDLPVKAYVRGDKIAGARFRATHVASGQATDFSADRTGAGYFRVTQAGAWRVEFSHLEAAAGSPSAAENAGYVLHTATLTFDAPNEEVRK